MPEVDIEHLAVSKKRLSEYGTRIYCPMPVLVKKFSPNFAVAI